jgi:hypothetical protein
MRQPRPTWACRSISGGWRWPGCRPTGQLQPQALIQGHTVLTELFTIDAVPGLHAALTDLHRHVLDGIRHGLALPAILDTSRLPEVLRNHPNAVAPYLTIRGNFAARLYHQHAGYW